MPLVKNTEMLPFDLYYQTEIWFACPGYLDYEVSCYGNVRSLKSGVPVFLKPSHDSDGYLVVGLFKNNRQTKMKVHRLQAMVFVPNPNNLPVVNHLDRVRDHNFVWNVEWGTVRENTSHSFKNKQTYSKYTGVCIDKRRLTNQWTSAININGRQIYLGACATEEQAASAYQLALINNQIINKYI